MITNVILTNWKGLEGRFHLTERTVLVGPNGSGKTAILEAIQVGLTGYAGTGKKPGAVLTLASDKACTVTLEDDKGNLLSRKFERKGSGGSQTITLNGEVVQDKDLELPESMNVPVEAIHPAEFLAMSGDKRAAWLFDAMGGDVTKLDPKMFEKEFPCFREPMAANELIEKIKAEIKTTKKEHERCVALIQKLTGDAGELPAGTRNEWEKKLEEAEKEYNTALQEHAANLERLKLAGSKAQHRTRLEDNIRNCEEKIRETEGKIAGNQDMIRPVDPTSHIDVNDLRQKVTECIGTATERRARAKDLRKRIELLSEGVCPTCGTKAEALTDSIDEWDLEATLAEQDAEDADAKAKELNQQISEVEQNVRLADRNQMIENETKVLQDALKSYQSSLEKYQEELADLDKDSGDAEATDPAVLEARVAGAKANCDQCREAIRKFEKLEASRGARTKAEEDRQLLEQALSELKGFQKEVKAYADKALSDLTGKIIGPFETAAMNAFGCQAFLEILNDKGKPTADFGIEKNNGTRVGFDTLSGGERTILLAALVAALQIAKTGKPQILLAEMAEADANRLGSFVDAVKEIGFEQAVMATCHDQLFPVSRESEVTFLMPSERMEEAAIHEAAA